MEHNEIKKCIKRYLKKGKFNTITTSQFNIKATARALSQSWCYYTEYKNNQLLAYNTITKSLTLYIVK
jgi:hypothetical protein